MWSRRALVLLVLALGLAAWDAATHLPARALLPGEARALGAIAMAGTAGAALLLGAAVAALIRLPPLRRAPPSLAVWIPGLALALLVGMPADPAPSPPLSPQPPQEDAPAAPPLVLVTLDTLRADHVGAIGGARRAVQTPHLDRLAAAGRLYTRGVAPVPLTLPAHIGLLTGQHPLDLGVTRNGVPLPDGVETVATRLRAEGWRTGAVVSSAVLRASTGLDRGFEHYDDAFDLTDRLRHLRLLSRLLAPSRERPGEQAVARALDWLAIPDGRPTFLWVHLYDIHAPYAPPAPWDTAYPWDAPDAQGNPAEMKTARALIRAEAEVFSPWIPPDLRRPVAMYAGEVSWTDALFGRLWDALPPDTRLVVASDHGESLTEHGALLSHGAQVYDTTTRVPLWVHAPGVAPARVHTPVSSVLVAPTLLALAGLDPGGPTLLQRGVVPDPLSVAPPQQSRDAPMLKAGVEVGLWRGEVKWVARRDGAVERYLPLEDPGEASNTAAAEPPPPELAQTQARADATLTPLDAETAAELEALGYVGR